MGLACEAKRKHFDRLKSHKKCWLIVMLMYRFFKENINKNEKVFLCGLHLIVATTEQRDSPCARE